MFLILSGDPRQDGKLTFEVYYDLLWNAAYQHDLNKAAGQNRGRLSSHMTIPLIILPQKLLLKVNECQSDGGMDPSDIYNVMSVFKAKAGNPPQHSS